MSIQIKVRTPTLPAALLRAIERADRFLEYTEPRAIYYAVQLDGTNYAGVFGDGDNAAYEWFVWEGGKLTHSNQGYGMSEVALRDALKKAVNW
jgi:hypothetical protein